MTKLKVIIFITAVFILGGIMFAWQSKKEPAATAPIGAKAGDLHTEPCTIKLDSGKYDADCGALIAPENRANSDTRLIALPITRIRATTENRSEPIFYLEGGPGMSNMHAKPPAGLLENHDFVMVGYRGVDGSVKLDCPEVAQAIKGDGVDVLSERSRAGLSAAMRQCAARLQADGVDLDGYAILDVIGDMEAARSALGYERINLFSASYGTRVAQLYANLHPDQIYRSAMVGVNPHGRFVWEPDMIDAQIERYSQLYAQSDSPRTPNLAETMRDVSHNMPQQWLFFKIDPGKVKSVTFAMLFHRNTAAMVFDAWLAAENGDPSGLALMSLAYDFMLPNMSVYGEFFAKGVSADYDAARDYAAEMELPDSIIGSPLSQLIWGSATDADGVTWPTQLIPAEMRQVQPSATETLLISGNVDFSTPAEFATDELLPALANGKQVILSEMGHVSDVMTLQPEAIERLLTSFYDSDEADDSLFTYEPMDFQVKLGFPQIAKLALGVVSALLLAIGGAIWFVVRRRQ
ncbi:MAG: alpha/beta hydrolase [Chloroflexi bacterium]|nr:alpha/beta hydrolase [Chloroflexota bacterium]